MRCQGIVSISNCTEFAVSSNASKVNTFQRESSVVTEVRSEPTISARDTDSESVALFLLSNPAVLIVIRTHKQSDVEWYA